MMKYIVGVYTTAPQTSSWNPVLNTRYYDLLKGLGNLKGIELPIVAGLHPFDDEWLLANIDPDWEFVFTCMPGVMDHIAEDVEFGIASDVEAGRQAALTFYGQALQAVLKLNSHLNRQAVSVVQLHTSPNRSRATSSSSKALQTSLEEMQSWNWDGAQLVVEHCDTYIENQLPEKGFLTIDEEIAAITAVNSSVGSDIGLYINWGRSALEARSTSGPLEHIQKARNAKLLKGLVFSGASGADTPYEVWKDTHMPPAQAYGISHYAEGSLLTAEEITKCLDASDYRTLDLVGLKITARPHELSVEERVAYIRDALAILDKLTD